MHELSLTEGVIRLIEQQAGQHGFTRVTAVCLEIGALSTVEPEAMEFCFSAVAKGNPVTADARLEIVRIPGQGYCLDCSHNVTIENRFDPCPNCGGGLVQVTGGDEMKIKELEVE